MEEQQISGGLNQGVGRVKEAAGALFGDLRTEAQGRAQQLRGQAQSVYGDALDQITSMTSEKPAIALGAALGLGLIIGLILAR